MYPYLEQISERYSSKASCQVREILENLEIPIPEPDEYLLGREHTLIFLNSQGLVIRVGEPLPCPEHDLILKPLKLVQLENSVFEILPGVDCGISPFSYDFNILKTILQIEGMNFWDWEKPSNIGLLPINAAPFEGRVPVVLDRGAVRKEDSNPFFRIKEFNGRSKGSRVPVEYIGLQEKIFAPIRNVLLRAWPEGEKSINKKYWCGFLSLCEQEIKKCESKEPSLLSNLWEDNRSNQEYYKSIIAVQSSQKFQEQLDFDCSL